MSFTIGTGWLQLDADTKPLTANLDRAHKYLDGLGKKFDTAAKWAKRFLVAEVALFGGATALAAKQQQAEQALDAALEASGQRVAEHSQRLRAMAGGLQKVTTHGDETILMLMAQATNLGITADQMEPAIKGALGLSRAFGVPLNDAMKKVGQAFAGNFESLNEMIPALKKVTDPAAKLALVMKTLDRGFRQEQAAAKQFVGQLQQLKDVAGDAGEQLGNALLPSLTKLFALLTPLVARLGEWIGAHPKLVLGLAGAATALASLVALLPAAISAIGLLAAGLKLALANLALIGAVGGIGFTAIATGAQIALASIVALSSYLAGKVLGETLDRTFDLSGWLLKMSSFLAQAMDIWAAWFRWLIGTATGTIAAVKEAVATKSLDPLKGLGEKQQARNEGFGLALIGANDRRLERNKQLDGMKAPDKGIGAHLADVQEETAAALTKMFTNIEKDLPKAELPKLPQAPAATAKLETLGLAEFAARLGKAGVASSREAEQLELARRSTRAAEATAAATQSIAARPPGAVAG
jgi:phage-related tail protein